MFGERSSIETAASLELRRVPSRMVGLRYEKQRTQIKVMDLEI